MTSYRCPICNEGIPEQEVLTPEANGGTTYRHLADTGPNHDQLAVHQVEAVQ